MDKAASDQEKYISNFRLREYGIGEDGRQKKEFAPLSRKLKNSIELLSTGLYAKDIHFILELIQNAEDNRYAGSSPELEFLILENDPTGTQGSDGCLCIFNNETGFTESNVESICGIGQSTKDKKHGYIGEKGIGFKSVFIVSSQPHIYSNGFHFCFKEDDPDLELAYIVPYWLDHVPDMVRDRKTKTAILLPLKKDKKKDIIDELERIEPETILFLVKLEGLAIEVHSNSKKIEFIRDKCTAPITDLLVQINGHQDHMNRYWMHEEDVAVPADVRDDKREGVSDRTISVAFPLGKADDMGKIFAFLPTDVESGLPFIVNADFILSASRETIQTGRKWNEWLRNSLAQIVSNGIKRMLENKAHQIIAYRFIPLVENLQSLNKYFSPVCEAIHKDLANSKVVLSDSGEFNSPELSRLASKRTRHLFRSKNRPNAFTSLNFVDAGIEKYSEQLNAIGVKTLLVEELKQCFSDREWLKGQDSGWFTELYTFLFEAQKAGKSMVNNLPIILLDSGDVVCPATGPVYFPADKGAHDKLSKSLTAIGFPTVRFLHSTLYDAIERSLLLREWSKEALGLLEFKVSTFIINTLVPWADDHIDAIVADNVMQLTQLILHNWQQFEDADLTVIRDHLPLVLEDGQAYINDTLEGLELLTPKGLDSEKGWQLFLVDKEDYAHHDVLTDDYLSLKADRETLLGFLECIDAEKYPSLRKLSFTKHGNKESPYRQYLTNYESEYPSNATSTPKLTGWFPPASFLDVTRCRRKNYRFALFLWLEKKIGSKNWVESIDRAEITWFYYTNQGTSIESGLHYYLMNTEWINTSKGYKRPGEVFVKSNQLYEMFGNQFPYLKDELSLTLCKYMGIKTEATTESIVEYLKELSTGNDFDFKLVCRLYKYLDDYGSDYEQVFADTPLICLPESEQGWYRREEVVWEDLSSVFGDLYPGLAASYESCELRGFFQKKLKVSETVGAEELGRAWVSLGESGKPDPENVRDALEKIFPKILEIAAGDETKPAWWQGFIEVVRIWTQGSNFVDPKHALAADDGQLLRFFKGQIPFFWKPERYTHQEMLPLYRELGVGSLSGSTEISLKSSAECHEVRTPSILTEYSKRLLGYLVYNYSRDFYLSQVDSGALKAIMQGIECECATVEVQYSVKGFYAKRSDKERKAFWDTDSSTLYLLTGADGDDLLDESAEAIAKAIWGAQSRRWDDSVSRVLGVTVESRYRKLHDTKGWHMPPEDSRNLRNLIDSPKEDVPETQDGKGSGSNDGPEVPAQVLPMDADKEETPAAAGNGDQKGNVLHESTQEQPLSPQTTPQTQTESEPETPLYPFPQSGPREDSGVQQAGSPEGATAAPTMVESGGGMGRPQSTGRATDTRCSPATGGSAGRSTPRSGRSRSRSTSTRINSARQSRIVSYPYPETNQEQEDSESSKEEMRVRKEMGDKAEQFIFEQEKAAGNITKRMPPNHPGYDIESVVRETGEVRYIEVKGQRTSWGARGVGLTYTQFKTALEKGRSYWLYVVENVESDIPSVFRINDPAHRATEYRYDSNWAQLAAPGEPGQAVSMVDVSVLVEELKGYTEDENCKEIIAHCYESDLSLPEVGYELASDDGAVLGEIEMAWPDDLIAIALPRQEAAARQFQASGWQIFNVSDTEKESHRGTLFGSISSIEDTIK